VSSLSRIVEIDTTGGPGFGGGYIDACNVMLFFIDRHARRSVASPGAS
jgi:hypothetical protein